MTDVATKQWYIVHTYSGFEKKVSESLQQRVQAYGLQDEIGEVFRSGFDFIKMEVRRDHWAAPNSIVTNTEDEGPQVNGLHA